MKNETPLPWFVISLAYFAGIAMIFIRSDALESDTARLIALGMQFILAGAMVHGVTKMRGVLRDAARIRNNHTDLNK